MTQEDLYKGVPDESEFSNTYAFSPEFITSTPASREVDIWAFGWLAFELINGREPFSTGDEQTFTSHLELRSILVDPIPALPAKWPPCFNDFV